MNVGNSNIYDGSKSFSFVSDWSGLGIDQVNFLIGAFSSLFIAYFFRVHLSVSRVSITHRHLFQIFIGFIIAYFCYGRQVIHLLIQSSFCFILMKFSSPDLLPIVGVAATMGYMTLAHLYRHIYDYGNYTLDITGPLMLNTQRLSSLAFALKDSYDDKVKHKKLSVLLKNKSVSTFPSMLEYTSFIFSFQSILCGPVSFYKDYIDFIEGRGLYHQLQVEQEGNLESRNDINNNNTHKRTNGYIKHVEHPHDNNITSLQTNTQHYCNILTNALIERLLTSLLFGLSFLFILPLFPLSSITGGAFEEYSLIGKILMLVLYTSLQRQKYFFAWKLGEATNIMAGFGYMGVGEDGGHKWDLACNVNVLDVEFSTSLKVLIDNWNISTATWLRYIIYERSKNIVHVFLFSAFWHGFYPGYYLTFCTGGLFITTARMMRRTVRPHTQHNRLLRGLYDTITFVASRLALVYLGFPFLVLQFSPIFLIFKQIYFCGHIVAVIIIITISIFNYFKNSHNNNNNRNNDNNNNSNDNNNNRTNDNNNNSNDNNNKRMKDHHNNTDHRHNKKSI